LPNDPDAGQTHTFVMITPPANGVATIDTAGRIAYTPDASFTGNDSLVVFVTDSGVPPLSGTAIIDITVE
jgi:VCBS repeat-containing protein